MNTFTEPRLQRGNLLWEGSRFLLPEHKQSILPLFQHKKQKEKPILDEQAFGEIERALSEAITRGVEVCLSYWEHGDFQTLVGTPIRFDQTTKRLIVKDSFDETFPVSIESMIDARIQNES
ncbi:YolD-like family protein [Bacillus sp. FJAT-45037]|uniref:YolD-like family protein n=1 Tax=Bacillus sp. FJAT-45037 TaxID=2011007 RepID=UPI000C23D5FE|nr:YolD-like family protein [Bacillus sp. FJAT-45037]